MCVISANLWFAQKKYFRSVYGHCNVDSLYCLLSVACLLYIGFLLVCMHGVDCFNWDKDTVTYSDRNNGYVGR